MSSVADMPVLNDRGSPVVEVAINGKKAAFVVDTGAQSSLIFEQAVEEYGLPLDLNRMRFLGGIGGLAISHPVTVDQLSLGTAIAHHVELDSVPGRAQRSVGGLPVIGLFGGDFLANYDTEFNLPGRQISLYKENRHCSNNVRPWAQGDYYRLPFELEHDTAVMFDISINGHKERVALDSGAQGTVIDRDAGHETGATRQTMTTDRHFKSFGIDGNEVETYRHRFDSLDIGDEHFAPAWLNVADMEVSGLLGADFFRSRKVWISYAHSVLYVQRVVFPPGYKPPGTAAVAATAAPKH